MNGEGPILNEAMESPMTFRRFHEEVGAPYGRRVPCARRRERGGEADALLINVHPQFGRIARLFSNEEEFDKYLEFRGAPLGHYRKMTVEDTSAGTKGQ